MAGDCGYAAMEPASYREGLTAVDHFLGFWFQLDQRNVKVSVWIMD
jgi:hypothetical protein